MANSKRKCRHCGEFGEAESGVKVPLGWFCSHSHAVEFAMEKSAKQRERQATKARKEREIKEKEARKANKARSKELNRSKHLDQLQRLVNQYVVHVRDADQPCCTCGTRSPDIKYDAGHFRSRGACPEARFILTNIHKQCSVRCNVHGSGMRAEYIEFILARYGQEHLDWLNGKHPTLKEQFPDAQAIDAEIAKYRKLLRDAGIKPSA
jgi:hypothetical protein